MEYLKTLLIITLVETFYLIGSIICFGLILGILRKKTMLNFQRSFGRKAILITGIIGTPIHELSHAIVALIFKHQITEIKLLQFPDEEGTIGYVNHSYNTRSIYQQIGNFFIGVAPILGGVFSLILLMKILAPGLYSGYIEILTNSLQLSQINKSIISGIISSYGSLVASIFTIKNLADWHFIVFIILSICVSTHISLSPSDIKGAIKGLIAIFVLLFILNLFGIYKFLFSVTMLKYNIVIAGFLLVSIIFSSITYLISLFLLLIKQYI